MKESYKRSRKVSIDLKAHTLIKKNFHTKVNYQDLNYYNFNASDQQYNKDNIAVNSSKWPFGIIATGLLFTTFTLNFRNLQYILPTLGILMIFSGFRSLQGVNEILKKAWFLTIFRLVLHVIQLIVLASPWSARGEYSLTLGVVGTLYQIIFLITFRNGMKLLFHDIDMNPSRDPLKSAIAWNITVVILGLFGLGVSLLVFIPMIIWLIAIISSINKYSDDLQFIPYNTPHYKGIRSNLSLGIGYIFLCFLFILGTSAISNHLRLDSSVFLPGTDQNIRVKLTGMGFPEHILDDMSDENIQLFQYATHVEAQKYVLMFDPKYVSTSETKDQPFYNQVPGDINMESTTVYIEMEDGYLYVLEYFEWTEGSAYWQDGFTIRGEDCMELLDGKLLYEEDGIDYIASIPRLTYGSMMNNNIIFGGSYNLQISGGVSYPFGSTQQRGYVLYHVLPNGGTMYVTNNLTYKHTSNPFNFPYTEAEQDTMSWGSGSQQHYSGYTLEAYKDGNQ